MTGTSIRNLCIAALGVAAGAAQAGTRVQLATGAQYSDGEYGETTNTNAFVVPFYARVSTGAWSFQASVPWVRVSGPQALGDVFDDDGGFGSHGGGSNSGPGGGSDDDGSGGGDDDDDDPDPPTPPVTPVDREVSGIGDTSLTASYSFSHLGDSPLYVDVRGRVRLPTGSRREGTGSGATDYALLTEVGYDGDRGGAYVGGGRRFLGTVNDVERVDGWQASAGAWLNASARCTVGVNVDWRDASTSVGDDPAFAEGWVAWRFSDVWKVEFNGGIGLSDASPDFAAGVTLTWRWK